jgi:hypothetical protein
MAMKPNLDQGNPAAKPRNSPSPLAKNKRANLARTSPMAKARNVPSPYAKNRAAQTLIPGPTNVPPRDIPDDARVHRELTTGKRSNSHSRSGR